MPVVSTPYLERVADRITDDEEPAERTESGGASGLRIAGSAAVTPATAALAARRLKRSRAVAERQERRNESVDESAGRRRVVEGWIRR